jgi:hypothetical protein
MLAYVFWHWRREDVPPERYRGQIRDFHASLARRGPAGFLGSVAFAIPGAEWIPGGIPAFEDWYLLEGSAALDPLDRGAVSPPHQASHDTIAGVVAGGTGGLYRLRQGTPLGAEARVSRWFSKPEGTSYSDLFELLAPACDAGAALWSRQMVLGPALEFCLHARETSPLPSPLRPRDIALERVWP